MGQSFKIFAVAFYAGAIVGLSSPALAQTSNADAGRLQRQIEESKPLPARRERETEIESPSIPAEPEKADVDDGVSFILGGVVVQGSSVFEPSRFTEFYADLIARQVTSADIDKVASAITDLYKSEGYVLTRAEVRPQEVASGVLFIDVVEGFVADVSIEGDGVNAAQFMPYFRDVLDEQPTRLATIERAVHIVGDLPGYWVAQSNLEEGDAPGAYRLRIVLGHDTFDFFTYLDNRGSAEIGRLESWTAAGANDVLGLNERLQLGFFTNPLEPQEVLYGEFSWTQPIGSSGTVATATVSATETDSGGTDRDRDLESKSRGISLDLFHPLLRGSAHSIWATGSLDFLEIKEIQRGNENFDDKTRVLRAGLRYLGVNRLNGDHFIQLEASQGLDILQASKTNDPRLSRTDAETDFTKIELTGRRVQRLGDIFSFELAGKGQWSDAPLLTSEEFSLGGGAFGRAYEFGEVKGEGGVAGLAEARVDLGGYIDFLDQMQLYAFYDIGTVFNDNAASGRSWESAASGGGGVRLSAFGVNTDLQIAKPLTRVPSDQNDEGPRYIFAISLGL